MHEHEPITDLDRQLPGARTALQHAATAFELAPDEPLTGAEVARRLRQMSGEES